MGVTRQVIGKTVTLFSVTVTLTSLWVATAGHHIDLPYPTLSVPTQPTIATPTQCKCNTDIILYHNNTVDNAHVTRQSADVVLSVEMAPIFNLRMAIRMAALALLPWLKYQESFDQSTCSRRHHVTSGVIAPLACISSPSQCNRSVYVATRRRWCCSDTTVYTAAAAVTMPHWCIACIIYVVLAM